MDYGSVLHSLKLKDKYGILEKHWDLSQASYPGKEIFFLEDAFLHEMNEVLNLNDAAFLKLLRAAGKIRCNEALSRLIWHCHYVLFHLPAYFVEDVKKWPSLPDFDIDVGDMFDALVGISGIPQMKKIYENLKIPEEVFIDTLSYVNSWMHDYNEKNGRWGFSKIAWFRYHQLAGKLFKLGRLEYEIDQMDGNIKVFRNKNTKKVVALSNQGINFRSDGQVNGTNGIFDKSGSWVSELIIKDDRVIGNPVHPLGYAINKKVELELSEWELVLEKGDPVLDIHIPSEGKLLPQLVSDSFDRAVLFFRTYFSNVKIKAFYCGTWFLDSQFRTILSPDSSIVKFQENFHLFPALTDDSAAFYWIFGGKPEDLSTLPQKTSLQRGILSFYEKGGRLRTGWGFILIDGNKWGQEYWENII